MRVDHGGGHVVVPKQPLNSADISSTLKQVGRKGMTKRMSADLLRQTGAAHRCLDGFVDNTWVKMVATGETRSRINRERPGRKDILPAPFPGSRGVFARQRIREIHRTIPLRQIMLMERVDPSEVVLQQRRQGGRKGSEPILVTL